MASKSLFDAPRSNVWHFQPDKLYIIRDPAHPLYDKREALPLDEGLVDQMLETGVLEPILVIKHADLPEELRIPKLSYETPIVVDGAQRTQHLLEVNKRIAKKGGVFYRIKAISVGVDELPQLWKVKVGANFHRPDSMLEKGQKAKKLMTICGWTVEETARYFGKTVPGLQLWLDLTKATPKVADAIERGEIKGSAAGKLCGLPKGEQDKALEEFLASDNRTVANAARVAKAHQEGKKPKLERKGLSKSVLRKIYKRCSDITTPMPVAHGFLRGIAFTLGEDDFKGLDDNNVTKAISEVLSAKGKRS